ncbi:MAG: hypothetical protein ABUT20_65790, partial [Bacteroidota bacterium]
LRKIQTPEIARLLDVLVIYCEEPNPENLQPFYSYPEKDLVSAVALVMLPEDTDATNPTPGLCSNNENGMKEPDMLNNGNIIPTETPKILYGATSVEKNTARYSEPGKNSLTVTRRSSEKRKIKAKTRKGNTRERVNPRQKLFIAGACFCLFILGLSYFLGGLADNINTPSFQYQSHQQEKQEAIVKKNAQVQYQPSITKSYKQPVDSSLTNKPAAIAPEVKNEQTESTAKISRPPAETKTAIVPVSLSMLSTGSSKSPARRRSVSGKINDQVSMNSTSFRIGTAPKE